MENNNTNQLAPAAEVQEIDNAIAIYTGASQLSLTKDEQANLLGSFDAGMIEIRPDGLIYLPQAFWRQRLNTALGIGQWALVVKGSHKDPARNKLYLQGVLMIRGCYVAESVGEAEYHETNKNQSWASVWESAKSDCITRCCKDLGIASELWQPQFSQKWVAENAVKVWVEVKKWNSQTKAYDAPKKEVAWRKKTAAPFYNETGIVPGQQPAAAAQQQQAPSPATKPAQPAKANSINEPAPNTPPIRDERYYKDLKGDVELLTQLIDDPNASIAELRNLANCNIKFFQSNPEMGERIKARLRDLAPKPAPAATA